ncbi:NACHT domain-containing protein [Curvivirga aplysinae]|uniref:hypothetical protein n=1 Tax=Curvivirga aplysinae TaxID=2529852 RepID=UPI0012BBCD75|nr:hypothetical protein [Curvivirga aplysinae]MTI08784.1 hypothetical protein [Curvivirga aplysinae]
MSNFYLPRKLLCGEEQFSEEVVLAKFPCLVVLAEPGAGKTRLLDSFANKLNVRRIRANVFKHETNPPPTKVLIIDGIDEVSRTDSSAVEQIFANVRNASPEKVVFASRSGEWNEVRNAGLIRDFLELDVQVARLEAFSVSEQKELFLHLSPDADFEAFYEVVDQNDLSQILPNPQFLEIFAKAFRRDPNSFSNKYKVFQIAIEELAKEHNDDIPLNDRPTVDRIVELASEVFTKLLLSGATGISIRDESDENYPSIQSLCQASQKEIQSVLDSGLFKLSESKNTHEPVHRIIAEFCAAMHLSKKLKATSKDFTFRRCISILAPNGVSRIELRGVMGWLACISGEDVQLGLINIDPYAVLSNGMPALLTQKSKAAMLKQLGLLSEEDPYFRYSDKWRRFSVREFFQSEMVPLIAATLSKHGEAYHLRGLILELLSNSEILEELKDDFEKIIFNPNELDDIRELAAARILEIEGYDYLKLLDMLISDSSKVALKIGAQLIEELNCEVVGREASLKLLEALPQLYPSHSRRRETVIGGRYFIDRLVRSFSTSDAEFFLDQLSSKISCQCGKKKYDCFCRNGKSKIVGRLLDNYFSNNESSLNPVQIWGWLKNLHYNQSSYSMESTLAVKKLRENTFLRREIYKIALTGFKNRDALWDFYFDHIREYAHAGLQMQDGDSQFLLEYAFEVKDFILWQFIYPKHSYHGKDIKSDPLRALARSHAHQDPDFMKIWAKENKARKDGLKAYDRSHERRMRRRKRNWKRKDNLVLERNRKALLDNIELVERGEHFGFLIEFASYYLYEQEEPLTYVDDPSLPERSLLNSIPFLLEDTPDIETLAKLDIKRSRSLVVEVLIAVVFIIFKREGSLANIDLRVLRAVYVDWSICYPILSSERERDRIREELVQHIFQTDDDKESFVREYVEPQLAASISHPSVGWLDYREELQFLRVALPLEWLKEYPMMSVHAKEQLVDMVVGYGDQEELKGIILQKCIEINDAWVIGPSTMEQIEDRDFWYFRGFVFLDDCPDFIFDWFRQDKNSVLKFENTYGRFNRGEKKGWPGLSTAKMFWILDTFVEVWPQVHLPNSYGTHSPKNETAYRFLNYLVSSSDFWKADRDGLSYVDRMLSDNRFGHFEESLKHLRSELRKANAHETLVIPTPQDISTLLDQGMAVNAESLRNLLIDHFDEYQVFLQGEETDPLQQFYKGGEHVDENEARNRIVEYLKPRLKPKGIDVQIEHHMRDSKRCDFTLSLFMNGKKHLIPVEVKGQWHREVFTAVSSQLDEFYTRHPDAEYQGVYLVLWFGKKAKIAGLVNDGKLTPQQLEKKIIENIPVENRKRLDVFILDLDC